MTGLVTPSLFLLSGINTNKREGPPIIRCSRVAKFDLRVGIPRTNKIKNLVILVVYLVAHILLPYIMYVVFVLILLFLLVRER